MIMSLFLSGCVGILPLKDFYEPRNYRDYTFRIREYKFQPSSPLVSSYRHYWGKVIFSECKNLPSDSAYIILTDKNVCNRSGTLFQTVGRLLQEHDLDMISAHGPIVVENRAVWIDFPSGKTCD